MKENNKQRGMENKTLFRKAEEYQQSKYIYNLLYFHYAYS